MDNRKRIAVVAGSLIAIMALALVGMRMMGGTKAAAAGCATTLSATKTASGVSQEVITWSINKSVTPSSWDLFKGDSGTSQYTVTVTKNMVTRGGVSSQICVTNGGSCATENLRIVDEVQYNTGGGYQKLATAEVDLSLKPVLQPGESYCYPYTVYFTPVPGATYKNTAHVTITNHAGWQPGGHNCPGPDLCPFGPDPSADFTLPSTTTTTEGSSEIHVTDTNGGSWTFNGTGTQTYVKTFECSSIPAGQTSSTSTYPNTATITETSQSSSAAVAVNCYSLTVTKDATTSLTRKWNWTIDKSADQTNLVLVIGQIFRWVNYTILVNAVSTDSNWAVAGNISVYNPAPIAATINNVSDQISGGINGNPNCSVTFPYTLPAHSTLNCTYSASLENADARTNTATARLQNYSYNSSKQGTPSGTTDFSGTASVDFSNATINKIDECANVTDSMLSCPLGTVCASLDALPKTFTCSKEVGPYSIPGKYTITNTATVDPLDTHNTSRDSWSINVLVPMLTASVDASATLRCIYPWEINKSVTPETLNLFTGDSGTSQYTVIVTKEACTNEAYITGEVCVKNWGDIATQGLTITLEVYNGQGTNTLIATGSAEVNVQIPPGSTECYSYKVEIPPGSIHAGGTYKVIAHPRITNDPGNPGTPSGPDGNTSTVLPTNPIYVNDTIHVNDSNGGSWTFNSNSSESYTKTFSCNSDAGVHRNIATIEETGQSDNASVTVNCYSLQVSKTANTSLKRTWNWTISKQADQTALTLAIGQPFVVIYTILVSAISTDSDWAVNGNISVYNPAPIAATINSLADLVSPSIPATVSCSFPYTLAAGATLDCTYSASLPNATTRTNTATATLQNTPSGTTDFSGTAQVVFNGGTNVSLTDECAAISDTFAGPLGTICTSELPKTFTYTRTLSYEVCGDYTVNNTASFTTNDTQTTGSSSETVTVHVPCAGGCTLTWGYWKTHSSKGPAPYDDAWAKITPSGVDSPFFNSGKTYYQILWTPPAGGNTYLKLAHQYIAAVLNKLNGASSTTAVDNAINWATNFFSTFPQGSTYSKDKTANSMVAILDSYNTGAIGPGHCSE